ncbi:unnamed protein product [Rotaria sp. Silwood2]|nr:unnamed protein product [Rotaria sp. Silwood2]
MKNIAKEVKIFRENNGTIISIISSDNMTKICATIKQDQSTNKSNNSTGITINDQHNETEFMDTNDQILSVSRGIVKRAKEKGFIMEQDIDDLEYSSDEEITKSNKDLNNI